MTLATILNFVSVASGTFPVAAALYNYKRLDRVLRVAALFFAISVFFDLLLVVTPRIGVVNNSPFIHLFFVISIVFFTVIYYHAFHIILLKNITVGLGLLAVLILIGNAISGEGLMSFPTLSSTILSIILTILSLLYFYQLLNIKEFIHIEEQYMFWINSGALFYFGINIFLFMLFKRIVAHTHGDIWLIHDVTNFIANVLYSVGLLCKPRKTT